MSTTLTPLQNDRLVRERQPIARCVAQGLSVLVWQRLWMLLGMLCLATGIVGVVVPLLPTTDFVLLAAYCFSRGSPRWEKWLLAHPHLGPMVRDWRATRAVPLRAKQLATATMLISSTWAAWILPARTGLIPAAFCIAAATYLWSRPTRRPAVAGTPGRSAS